MNIVLPHSPGLYRQLCYFTSKITMPRKRKNQRSAAKNSRKRFAVECQEADKENEGVSSTSEEENTQPSPQTQHVERTSDICPFPMSELPTPTAPCTPIRSAPLRFQEKMRWSADKLSSASTDTTETDTDTDSSSDTRTIVELSVIMDFISRFLCPECGGAIKCTERKDKKRGLSVFIETFCSDCNEVVASTYTSSHVNDDERSTFSVNQAAVFGAMRADHGPYEHANYCESLNMPSLCKAAFRDIQHTFYKHNDEAHSSVSKTAIDIVKEHYSQLPVVARSSSSSISPSSDADQVPTEYPPVGEDGIFNLTVSYDGSWQTRGHTSNVGVVAVIEADTGIVIDTHAMSNFCQECADTGEYQKRTNPDTYPRWLENHKANGCDQNYQGNCIDLLKKI